MSKFNIVEGLPLSIIERMKEIEKENRFWEKLENIGFKCQRNCMQNMHAITHKKLPHITHAFYMDAKLMNITSMTYELARWIWAHDGENHDSIEAKTKPLMSCENFIKYMISKIRIDLKNILDSLDTITLN